MQVVHTRDSPVAWSSSLYHIGSRSQVYDSFLEEFPKSHGDAVDDEHYFFIHRRMVNQRGPSRF